MTEKLYDIIIVGAGPSGSVLGYLCSKAGHKTLVIEQKELPRFKVCGGGLTYKCIELFKRLDLYDANAVEKSCYSVEIHLPKLGTSYIVPSSEIYMVTVNRSVFDKSLIDKAVANGCEITAGNRFRSFEIATNNLIKIHTDKGSFKTNILVGADGVLSKIYKQLSKNYEQIFPDKRYLFGVTADIPLKHLPSLDPNHPHLFFNFATRVDYAWAFPKKDCFNVGLGSKHTIRARVPVKDSYLSFIEKVLEVHNYKPTLKGALLPIYWSKTRPAVQWANILLVGDAAGFVDEWTGEGLYYSVKSAENAFNAIRCYYDHTENQSKLYLYTKQCSRNIFNNLMLSHYFAKIFRAHPNGYHYLKYRPLREMFIPFAKGQLSYRQAFLRSFPIVLYFKTVKEIRESVNWFLSNIKSKTRAHKDRRNSD